LEKQKVREVSKKNHVFDLLDLEVERKLRGEIRQARCSMQDCLKEGRTDLLQEHSSRFESLADRLLERKVCGPILQARFSVQKCLEEERAEGSFEQKARGEEHSVLLQNQS
jgi:hypothetical protein